MTSPSPALLPASGPQTPTVAFWFLLVTLSALRLVMVSDLHTPMVYGPADESLYASRAYHLLLGEAFGPYNSYVLIKHPGISLWICFVRLIGVPFLFSVNLTYVLAGLYFVAAARRSGAGRIILLCSYILYLFNPISYDHIFLSAGRDGLYPALVVLLPGAMLQILNGVRDGGVPLIHLAVLSLVFSFVLLLREEAFLLCCLTAFGAILCFRVASASWAGLRRRGSVVIVVLIAPFVVAYLCNASTRMFVKARYGLALVNDFGSGEFPKFIAAIRSVRSEGKGRYVSISQDTIRKLRSAVPSLAAVIDRLPPPPGPGSYYHARWNVVNEWPNSHFFFWIKDSTYAAGLTPDLGLAQAYFRGARLEIERACRDGRLDCEASGGGLLPRLEMRWVPDLLEEMVRGARMMFHPGNILATGPRGPTDEVILSAGLGVVLGPPELARELRLEVGRMYQVATMAPFDSQLEWDSSGRAAELRAGWMQNAELYANLRYWLKYPDVACNEQVGLTRNLPQNVMKGILESMFPGLAMSYSNSGSVGGRSAGYIDGLRKLGLVGEDEPGWRGYRADVYLALRYLMESPDQAIRFLGGQAQKSQLGARVHYEGSGKLEGRTWAPVPDSGGAPVFRSPLERLRFELVHIYGFTSVVAVLGVLSLAVRMMLCKESAPGHVVLIAIAFMFYSMIQLVALAYVSVPMGTVDPRLYYSNYVILVLFGPLLVGDVVSELRAMGGRGERRVRVGSVAV